MGSAFITGATGFVGSAILEALITKTDLNRFYILVREEDKAKQKLSSLIPKAKNLNKNLIFIKGDISRENLGLLDYNGELVKKVDEVYHLAARISLSENNKERIFKTNVDGTKNLLKLFKDSRNLKNIYYFSTAYSCGRTNNLVKEVWMEKPSEFRNPYEESKWLAEELIQKYVNEYNIPIIVIRPTVIGSEDATKFNDLKNQTIYLHGRVIRKATLSQEEDKPIRLLGNSKTFINLITIEDIAKILIKIRSLDEKPIIYNFANSSNCLATSFLKGLQEQIGFKSGYQFIDIEKIKDLSETEKSIFEKTSHYFLYNIDSALKWDTSNTDKIRNELNLISKDDNWMKEHAKKFFLTIQNEEQ